MDEGGRGINDRLQRSIRNSGDPQAEEACRQHAARCGGRSGLHEPHAGPLRNADIPYTRRRTCKTRAFFSVVRRIVVRPAPSPFVTRGSLYHNGVANVRPSRKGLTMRKEVDPETWTAA